VSVENGAEARNLDIKLRKRQTVRVRGRVIDPSGDSNQTASVQLVPEDGYRGGVFQGTLFGGVYGIDGSFEIPGATPGAYFLIARKNIRQMISPSTPVWSAAQPL